MITSLVFLVTFLFTSLIAFLLSPVLRRLAFRFNILDIPGGRKIHQEPTPLLGGVAIYLGLVSGLAFFCFQFGFYSLKFLWPVMLGGAIIFVVGLINDLRELSVQVRLLAQVLAGMMIILSGGKIDFLPNNIIGSTCEIILTLVWIVGVTNAFNCLDGLDGLAAGSAAVNLTCFTVILYTTGQYTLGLLAVILMAACLGFLPHNFKKKKIFLGDAGSTFLGFMLASISLLGGWAQDNIVKIFIPVLILGVPIFDMIFTTFMRIRDGKVKTLLEWLKYTGKDHFHHYLVELGLKPRGAVVLIYFITFSLGISAIMITNDDIYGVFLSLSQAAIIFGIIATLIVVGRRHHSGWDSA